LVVQLSLDEGGQGLKGARFGILAAEEAVGDFLGPTWGWGGSGCWEAGDVAER
jgi:hypothetical protein